MTIFLLVLNIAGVMVSGATTLVALFRSKSFEEIEIEPIIIGGKKRVERHITREGKISAVLIVLGIVISVVAQTVQQSVNNTRNTLAQTAASNQLRKTDEQLRLAQTSIAKLERQGALVHATLDQIERVVTRFQELTVLTEVEIPSTDFNIQNFVDIEAKSAYTNLLPHISALLTNNEVGYFNMGSNCFCTFNSFAGFEPIQVDYVNKKSGRSFQFGVDRTLDGTNMIIEISLESLARLRKQDRTAQIQSEKIMSFINNPKEVIEIWGQDSPTSGRADFTASSKGFSSINLEYLYPSDRIRVTWNCDFRQELWTNNAKVCSLVDLGFAHVRESLENYPFGVLQSAAFPSATANASSPLVLEHHNSSVAEGGEKNAIKSLPVPSPPSHLQILQLDPNRPQVAVHPVGLTLVFNTVPIGGKLQCWGNDDFRGVFAVLPSVTTLSATDMRSLLELEESEDEVQTNSHATTLTKKKEKGVKP